MKGRGDGLLFLVVVGRGQKTNGTDSFVLTIPMSHLRRKLCQQRLPQFLCLISIAQTWNPFHLFSVRARDSALLEQT